MTSEGLFCSSI